MNLANSLLLISWIAIGILTLAVAGLIRQVRLLAQRATDSVNLADATKPELVLDGVQVGRLLLFLSADCRACVRVIADLYSAEGLLPVLPDNVEAIAITRGDQVLDLPAPFRHNVDNEGSLWRMFDVRLTPFAVLYSRDQGFVAKGPVPSGQHLVQLVNRLAAIAEDEGSLTKRDKEMIQQ